MPNATTPLLAGVQELPPPTGYLPTFLRVCHSPWTWISQATLIQSRGLIVAYLTALWPILINLNLRLEDGHSRWSLAFDFSVLSYLLLWIYHVIVFAEIDEDDDSWQARLLRAMSPPVQRPGDHKSFWFSLFYTTTQAFALISALVYWAVLVPQGYGYSLGLTKSPFGALKLFDESWFRSFWILNIWGVTVLIVFVEIMLLNNVKRQVPVLGHVFGLMALLAAYVGWAAVGKRVTGHSPYFFLDPDVVGSSGWIALYSAGFVALGPLVFTLLYGLIGMREKATRLERNST
ncbi:hypothetical protein CONLIGDRAFT_681207 [Coniochaeta ligniaria NRRL 30616]|uniref:FAR-17a/AIG1-like protein n=1 Tax=Coniochaeta ligniaria NRRL 30616 TaxID=1408157 RepID=A0A1J7IKZ4_9PEZI|nr:hypothetical protein CONLIGDRAFT_681207 [Coniochaeta ligniaria NRRL 30616]